jgi:hypothetical protein
VSRPAANRPQVTRHGHAKTTRTCATGRLQLGLRAAHQIGPRLVGLWAAQLISPGPGAAHQISPRLVGLWAAQLVSPGPGAAHQISPLLIRLSAAHHVRTLRACRASCHVSLISC